jgi:hypothetical protein
MELPAFVTSVVGWLRAGYPEGLPERDYIPLLALLARRLSDEEVMAVVDELLRDGEIGSPTAMRDAIAAVTHQPALDADVSRVADRLTAVGWPGALFEPPATPRAPDAPPSAPEPPG